MRDQKRQTLTDVSRELGFSVATISRVINHENNVTEETRRAVEEGLQRLNYKYRPRRKKLVQKNENVVVILAAQLTNPVIVAYIDGIREVLAAHSLRVLVSLTDYSQEREMEYLRYVKDAGFCGFFMINAVENNDLVNFLKSVDTPFVLVNRYLRQLNTDVVSLDNYRCGYMATSYLLQNGHRHISHLAGPESSITCYERARGYRDAMESTGIQLKLKENIYYGDNHYNSGYMYGRQLCALSASERPTAVFCSTGSMGVGLRDALQEGGLSVPEQISIVCCDDFGSNATPEAQLTTVGQDPKVMGRAAAEMFLARLNHPELPPRNTVFSPQLTERGSTIEIPPSKMERK